MMNLKKRDWFCLIAGTALMAVGAEGFFEHADLVAGGITGIGIMLDEWTSARFGVHIPLWFVNIVGNLPLFLIAWKLKGRAFVGRSALTAVLFSLMLFVEGFFPLYSSDPLLAAVYGGAALGVGLGLVLSADSTTGGVELAATLLNMKFRSISVSKFIFILDAAIILAGIGLFGVELGLYAILAVYITDQFIDWVIEGTNYAKAAWIISDKNEEIAAALLSELRRGVTAFSATGKYTGEGREVLFCVFSQKEVHLAKSIIMNIDRNAFFLLTDIREVLGKGFSGK
ncbi:YitT family protein [Anaerotignum sp.]|nr:YitT family protein [Anaerotignum sp.]MBQ7758301.1 YitT family protein [Anaerotignum sp.]